MLPLLLGILTRHRTTLLAGLLIAALSGWVTPRVMETGENADERYEEGPVQPYLDPAAKAFLEIHEHRAEAWAKVLYASAAWSTLGLLLAFWRTSWSQVVGLTAALACLASVGAGAWIAESGGKIRRPDFRVPPGVVGAYQPGTPHGQPDKKRHHPKPDDD